MPEQPVSIAELIGAIKNTLDHLAEAISAYQQSEAAQRKEELDTELKAAVRLPVEVTKYYESEERDRPKTSSRDNIRLCLEIAGVVAAVVLAILTLCTLRTLNGQLTEMRHQSRQSLESFRVDQRAWIEIDSLKPKGITRFPRTTAVSYEAIAKNFGKTVARDIRFTKVTALDANTDEAIRHRMIQNALKDVPPIDNFPKSLGPGTPLVIPFSVGGSAPETYGKGTRQETWYDYLIGRFDYDDAFGVAHWITFCFVIEDSNGNIGYCETGNDEDSNPELPPN